MPVAVALLAPAACFAAAEDPAALLYRPGIVNVIKLELPPSSIEALEAEPEEYQPGTFSLAETDGTPDGIGEYSEPVEAQIRLKGSGSFKPLGKKSAFKVKFSKKTPFRGLRKMTLNNMIQDTSMVHEALAYRIFRALGVPASRTSYAEVWVNGVNYGLHANVETLDKVAMEKRFGEFQDPPQHLYEGVYYSDDVLSDITESGIHVFEVDEGDEGDRSDLEALLYAHTHPGDSWSAAVSPYANLPEMTRAWMVEKYVGQFDGYAGWFNGSPTSNYYLYSDPAGRFRMFPWSLDWTFTVELSFETSAGKLFQRCLADVACLEMFRTAGSEVLAKVPQLDLDSMARCLALRLQPWQQREPPAMEPHSAEAVAAAVLGARNFIATRPQQLATYLGVSPTPQPAAGECAPYGSEAPETFEESPGEEEGEEEENEGGEEEGEGGEEENGEGEGPASEGGGGEPEQPAPSALPPSSLDSSPERQLRLRLGRLELGRHRLVVQVKAPGPGRLKLRIDGSRSESICTAQGHVRAGTTWVGCALHRPEAATLAAHRPRLTLAAVLRIEGGPRLFCRRTVNLPRP